LKDHKDIDLHFNPLEVKVNNNFDRAMKIFRALVQKEKILSTYKEKSRYEKPSDQKRRKRNEMKRKMMEIDVKFDLETHGTTKKKFRDNGNQSSQEEWMKNVWRW